MQADLFRSPFLTAHALELDAWAERAKAEIHALAVFHHRGIGQLYRHARARLARKGEQR